MVTFIIMVTLDGHFDDQSLISFYAMTALSPALGLENSCDFRSGTSAVIAQRDQTNLYNYIRLSIYRLLGEFQKFWVSLVYFYALFSLFPPHPHIVRHCVESRDFVRTHMSSDSKTMYHVVSGISLQSHRYVFGNVTAVLSLYIYVCAFLLFIPQWCALFTTCVSLPATASSCDG